LIKEKKPQKKRKKVNSKEKQTKKKRFFVYFLNKINTLIATAPNIIGVKSFDRKSPAPPFNFVILAILLLAKPETSL
jgi:hypothetical protein